MFKKLVVSALLVLVSLSAHSTSPPAIDPQSIFQLTKPMMCSNVNQLFGLLASEYGENASWIGKERNTSSYIAIYRNSRTGEWAIVQFDGNVGCVLGSGEEGSPLK